MSLNCPVTAKLPALLHRESMPGGILAWLFLQYRQGGKKKIGHFHPSKFSGGALHTTRLPQPSPVLPPKPSSCSDAEEQTKCLIWSNRPSCSQGFHLHNTLARFSLSDVGWEGLSPGHAFPHMKPKDKLPQPRQHNP